MQKGTMHSCVLSVILAAGVVCSSCTSAPPAPGPKTGRGKPVIYTTFYPTTYFAEVIGGEAVEVVCPCPADEDAIFWEPDRATIAAYQAADLIVINGAAFEKWVLLSVLPEDRMVDTARDLPGELITFAHSTTHSHGPAGTHSHEGIDGHTWVDPVNALVQARSIRDAMAARFPGLADAFGGGFARLESRLKGLDADLRGLSGALGDSPLLCSHPAYNYVARRYGWRIRNLDLDPVEPLKDEQVAAVRAILRTHPARIILWEGEPSAGNVARMKELGLVSVTFSPCELMDPAELQAGADYMSVMKTNIESLRAALKAVRG